MFRCDEADALLLDHDRACDDLEEAAAERDRYREALERIGSGESFTGTPGLLDRSFSGLQAQAMMAVARTALEGGSDA